MSLELITLIGVAVSLLLAALYRYLTAPYEFFQKRGLAGPRPALIFGTWWGQWNQVQGEEDLRRVKEFGSAYGTFDGRKPNLAVAEPALVRAVLLDKSSHFRSRRAQCVRDRLLHEVLQALESREARGPQDPAVILTLDNVRKLVPRMALAAKDLVKQIKAVADAAEGKVTITKLVENFLASVVAGAVFGLDSSAGEKAIDLTQLSYFLNQAFFNDNPDSPLAAVPFTYASLAPQDKFVLRSKALKYFTGLLQSKLQEKTAQAVNEEKVPDLLDLLILTQRVAKQDLDNPAEADEAALQARNYVFVQSLAVVLNTSLLARNVTSATTVLLAAKPELQERLHSELYEQLHVSNEFELVQNSEFLDMVVSEVLRLYPVEYRLERECCETLELDKVKIEQGTVVSVPVYALHRQEQLFPEPDTFDPDRFSRENKAKREPFSYLPFGQAGDSAANLSIQWSLLVAKLAIVSLLKNFKFLPGDDTKIPPPLESGVTGVPRLQPISLVVESRH